MTDRLIRWLLPVLVLLALPLSAWAQDEESKSYDARLEGYGSNVTLDSGSTAVTWLLLIILGIICLGVLFKSSGRSHLD